MNDLQGGGPAPRAGESVYIYPGSFDPVTFGHLDIITRASHMCGRLIIAIGRNREKRTMFATEERIEMLRDVVASQAGNGGGLHNVEVAAFSGLLADFAKKRGASVIVKGLRAMSDFEFEFQMALLNKYLDERLETVFLMTSVQYTYLSSSAVKEIALNGGRLGGLVPACVVDRIEEKALKAKELSV
ncbi:MAG: pantetheine-phosphate adenylyltransferase [Oscillospiraceae bacterium]|nr:pantetheine-phosphate adenylyltransferase [Oscillospiraceae bacterium]